MSGDPGGPGGPGNLFGDPGNVSQRRTPLTQKIYEPIFAKISIFPSKMVQETIQYSQEMSREAQETCHRVQESSLGYKLM